MKRFPLFYIILPILMTYAAVVFSSDSAVDFGERIDYSHTVYSIQMRDGGGIDFKDELGAVIMTLNTDGDLSVTGSLDVNGTNAEHLIWPSPGVPDSRPVLEIMSNSNVTGGIQFNANATDYWNQYYSSTAFILNHGTWAGVPTDASFTVLSNGNIGIDTIAPSKKLHVITGDAASLSTIKLVNNDSTIDSSATGIVFGVGADDDVQEKGGLGYLRTRSSARGNLVFLQENTADTSDVAITDIAGYWHNDGSLVIGSDAIAPAQEMVIVNPDSSGPLIQFVNSTTGVTGADGVIMGLSADEDAYIWLYEPNSMYFGANNTECMRINTARELIVSGSGSYADNGNHVLQVPAGKMIAVGYDVISSVKDGKGRWQKTNIRTTKGVALDRENLTKTNKITARYFNYDPAVLTKELSDFKDKTEEIIDPDTEEVETVITESAQEQLSYYNKVTLPALSQAARFKQDVLGLVADEMDEQFQVKNDDGVVVGYDAVSVMADTIRRIEAIEDRLDALEKP